MEVYSTIIFIFIILSVIIFNTGLFYIMYKKES